MLISSYVKMILSGYSGRVDVAFVFDSSGSIRNRRFQEVTEYFAQAIERTLEVQVLFI